MRLSDLHAGRIMTLARFMRTVPKEKLDLGVYATDRGCGTVCCVAGWAGTIPEFVALGLKTDVLGNGVYLDISKETLSDEVREQFRIKQDDAVICDLDAAQVFFGMTEEDDVGYFLSESAYGELDLNPDTVADVLEWIVEERNPEAYARLVKQTV